MYWFSRLDKKKEKATMNPKNEDDKYFQYIATAAVNYDKVKWNPERVSDIKPFINKYNWEKINYPSKTDDWKRLKQVIQQPWNKEKEGWHYLAVKNGLHY